MQALEARHLAVNLQKASAEHENELLLSKGFAQGLVKGHFCVLARTYK